MLCLWLFDSLVRKHGGAHRKAFYRLDSVLAKAFCLDLVWNADSRSVSLTSTGKRLLTAAEVYNSEDIYWLSRIINAEAGGEPFLGKIAVGNVVLNRVRSSQYPNTVKGVVFDRKYGVQFTPVANGTIYNTPGYTETLAAKICLEGATLSGEILFFMAPQKSTSFWIANTRTYAFSVGGHDFFK